MSTNEDEVVAIRFYDGEEEGKMNAEIDRLKAELTAGREALWSIVSFHEEHEDQDKETRLIVRKLRRHLNADGPADPTTGEPT